MKEMLKIESAALRLGGRLLLSSFGLRVKQGEWVCLTGESGCGKTSLLRAVQGFLPLEAGQVFVNGEKLGRHTVERIRGCTAYVPQELFLPVETVGERVRIPFQLKANSGRRFAENELLELWSLLGLERDLLRRRVVQLSGGQRQRVILSMAALLAKPLCLVDEPTSALDGESVGRVVDLFRRMAVAGTAVLSVSHNRDFLDACDRVIRL